MDKDNFCFIENINCKEKICFKCNNNFLLINKIIINEKEKNICNICYSIYYNFNKSFDKIIPFVSKLSQEEIINNTIKFYKKNRYIPNPILLDQKCKNIKYNKHIISLYFNNYDKNLNLKFFLNNNFPIKKILSTNMFFNNSDKFNFDINLIKMKKCKLNFKENNINNEINLSKKSLKNKIKNKKKILNLLKI